MVRRLTCRVALVEATHTCNVGCRDCLLPIAECWLRMLAIDGTLCCLAVQGGHCWCVFADDSKMGIAVATVLCAIAAAAGVCMITMIDNLVLLERQQSLHKLRFEAIRRQPHSKQLGAQLCDLQPADSSLACTSLLGCGLHPC